jgi:hypothetical protein
MTMVLRLLFFLLVAGALFAGGHHWRTRAQSAVLTGHPYVATCRVNGRDLGDVIVRRGMGIAYLRYLSKYMEAEVEARRARRGMWQGEFIEPEEWRHWQ